MYAKVMSKIMYKRTSDFEGPKIDINSEIMEPNLYHCVVFGERFLSTIIS